MYAPVQVHQSIVSLGAAAKDAGERGGWAAGMAAAWVAKVLLKLFGQRPLQNSALSNIHANAPRCHIRSSGAEQAAVYGSMRQLLTFFSQFNQSPN